METLFISTATEMKATRRVNRPKVPVFAKLVYPSSGEPARTGLQRPSMSRTAPEDHPLLLRGMLGCWYSRRDLNPLVRRERAVTRPFVIGSVARISEDL